MVPDKTEIETTIASAIRKALNREVGEITPDTSLVTDLAVDSLDLVEIVYDVEEAYDIQLEPDELFPQRLLRDPDNVNEGTITAGGIAKLREQFTFTSLAEIAPGTPVADVAGKLLTMRVFADYVAYVIGKKSE
ncbi:MAG: acyl carrier protein [Blastocatellia bacterium]|jgi:acyl carrier protein|nr:acyl carrier protein [Blastocatellia bacterium]MBK6428720.1 acyl carrier protein [Blastocatellia bacterium]